MLRSHGAPVLITGENPARFTISTADVHPRDRFEYWYETCKQILGPYEARPLLTSPFDGEVRCIRTGEISLSVVRGNAVKAWRTSRQANNAPDLVHIVVDISGNSRVSQDGREAELAPGDLCFIDVGRAASVVQSSDFSSLIIEVPRRDCEERLGPLGRWTAQRVDGSRGSGALASAFARMLPDQFSHLSQVSKPLAMRQFLDLLAMALKDAEGDGFVHSSARLASLLRLKSVVDANLSNGSATCEELASAAGISVRYANQLLDAEQTSLQRLLFSRRIEKCQAALADPGQAHRQISDIAYTWGFGDVSHFGRLFKSMVGMTPRDFRKQNLTFR